MKLILYRLVDTVKAQGLNQGHTQKRAVDDNVEKPDRSHFLPELKVKYCFSDYQSYSAQRHNT